MKNPLSVWIAEYLQHNPEDMPADAWRCLTDTAAPAGVFDWLLRFDAATGEIVYRCTPWGRERRVAQKSFTRTFCRERRRAAEVVTSMPP